MLTALLVGLLAAVLFGVGMTTSTRAAREAGVLSALLAYSVVSVLVSGTLAIAVHGAPGDIGQSDWSWLAVTGVFYAAGAGLLLAAVARGQVSLVVPIVACDGGVGAVLAIVLGSSAVSLASALCLGAMVVGVVLAVSSEPPLPGSSGGRLDSPTIIAAGLSAVAYGVVFFGGSEVTSVQPAWITAIARGISLLPIALVVLGSGAFRMPARSVWPWIVITGFGDALGYTAFLVAAEHDVPVASVSTAQYAALGVVGGVVVFRESLSRTQWVGVAVMLAAISLLAIVA